MIDMRGYFTHSDYPILVEKFEASFDKERLNCDDYWFVFTDLQKTIANNRCPICEVELNIYPNKTNSATLDHFKPKSQERYPKLKCDPKNYVLMCSLCNNTYKKDEFPLYSSNDENNGKALLMNLTEEDPLYFFELIFRQTNKGGVLELKRNSQNIKKNKNLYDYQRSQKMINLFGLGNCHKNIHPNDNPDETIKECRIEILTKHYTTFIEFAKAYKEYNDSNNKKPLALIMKQKNRIKELKKYGFYQFIINHQYRIQ